MSEGSWVYARTILQSKEHEKKTTESHNNEAKDLSAACMSKFFLKKKNLWKQQIIVLSQF